MCELGVEADEEIVILEMRESMLKGRAYWEVCDMVKSRRRA